MSPQLKIAYWCVIICMFVGITINFIASGIGITISFIATEPWKIGGWSVWLLSMTALMWLHMYETWPPRTWRLYVAIAFTILTVGMVVARLLIYIRSYLWLES